MQDGPLLHGAPCPGVPASLAVAARSEGAPGRLAAGGQAVSYDDHLTTVIAPSSSNVYYGGDYWNDWRTVAREIDRRVSGRPDVGYRDHFHELVDGRRFERALFLNCGDGNVERGFLQAGLIDSGVGIDISDDLIAIAREAARGLPLRYVQLDVNQGILPHQRYDLIVNNAAGHHIAYVDRVFRALCAALSPDGFFLHCDYVGPHRNQYPHSSWAACAEVNRSLPSHARQVLRYPHMPTMLHLDPSEAVHSELLLETSARYFTTDCYRPIGGAIAYPILSHNQALRRLAPADAEPVISEVLLADLAYLHEKPESTLFAFWFGRPKHAVLHDDEQLQRWRNEENAREERARQQGGRYYPPAPLERLLPLAGG